MGKAAGVRALPAAPVSLTFLLRPTPGFCRHPVAFSVATTLPLGRRTHSRPAQPSGALRPCRANGE